MADESDGGDETPKRKKGRRTRQLSPHYRANNAGGHGNPPVKGQFPTGNRGGPGRPKGQNTLESAMRKVLRRKIAVTRNGKSTKLPATEVYAERILEAILGKSNSPAMYEFGRRILAQYGPQDDSIEQGPPQADYSGFSREEMHIFSALLARAIGLPPDPPTTDVLGTTRDPVPVGEFRIFRGPDQHMVIERIDFIEGSTTPDPH